MNFIDQKVYKIMNNSVLKCVVAALLTVGLWSIDFSSRDSYRPVLAQRAHAVIGRPVTPVSYAGVARRTTRRAVAATSSAQQQQQAQQQQAQQAAAQSQPTPAALPKGTVVSALPAGCTSTAVDGVNLFNCGGVLYRPTFQSNTLV